jgi:hypothetical protein
MTPLYGLSLTQPWATLMALGAKQIETRSWGPAPDRLGHLVAIQAAKSFPDEARALISHDPFYRLLRPVNWSPVRGVVVAIGRLTDRARIDPSLDALECSWKPRRDSVEFALGDYSPGRWMWHFTEIEALERPVPVRGQQWVWLIEGETRHDILSQSKWRALA